MYNPNESKEDTEERLQKASQTKLTEYFEANQQYPEAQNLFYREFPENFTWKLSKNQWEPRKQIDDQFPRTIGRMVSIHPSKTELFCLRTLLNHIKGKTSFEDLQTVDGVIHETFKAACIALNFIQDDQMWIDCMEEAVSTNSASMCRNLFVSLLLNCEIGQPKQLFQQFKESLMEDYFYKYTQDGYEIEQATALSENKMLQDISDGLQLAEKTCTEFELPEPNQEITHQLMNQRQNEIIQYSQEFYDTNFDKLTNEQSIVFNDVMQHVQSGRGGMIFLDAPAGTGKTFLLNVIASSLRKDGDIALCTAASGIAAGLLYQGSTSHSKFKFPIPIFEESICTLPLQSERALEMKSAKVLILDEAPMLHRYNIEALDRYLKELTGKRLEFFGGKLVLLSGDFRQILPVIPRGNHAKIMQACLKNSNLWERVHTLRLTKNMRIAKIIEAHPE